MEESGEEEEHTPREREKGEERQRERTDKRKGYTQEERGKTEYWGNRGTTREGKTENGEADRVCGNGE